MQIRRGGLGPSLCGARVNGRCRGRSVQFGPLGGSVLPSLVPLVSKHRGCRRLCVHRTDHENQCTQVGHMGIVDLVFVVYPKRLSRDFGESEFAFVRRAVHWSAVFTTNSNIYLRVSRGTFSSGAVGCGLLRTEHVKSKTQQSIAASTTYVCKKSEARRGARLRCAQKLVETP